MHHPIVQQECVGETWIHERIEVQTDRKRADRQTRREKKISEGEEDSRRREGDVMWESEWYVSRRKWVKDERVKLG